MIDIESELFTIVATKLRDKFGKSTFMTGEYIHAPKSFPCISFMEIDNQVWRNARSTDCIENHSQIIYEVNVFSNKQTGKKSECKEIIGFIDSIMADYGFTRVILTPVPNEHDATIYRMAARYTAIVGKKDKDNNYTIYRR